MLLIQGVLCIVSMNITGYHGEHREHVKGKFIVDNVKKTLK
jgi:hypothetical protein